MATTGDRWTAEDLLAAFDEHLRRTRGVCEGTRRNYGRYVRGFLETVFAGGPVDVATISAREWTFALLRGPFELGYAAARVSSRLSRVLPDG